MADINLERKPSGGMGWLWTLLALVVIALVAWWLWPDNGFDDRVEVETTEITEMQPTTPEEVGLARITRNPSDWMNRTFPAMEVTVGDRMTDRGFFIEADGVELLALIIDEPREVPLDINPGQRLRITGGTLRGPGYLGQIEGVPLTAETEALVRERPIYLVVDESNITILEEGTRQTAPGMD
jgi:hypothetical protein